jgi:hypothetical protein
VLVPDALCRGGDGGLIHGVELEGEGLRSPAAQQEDFRLPCTFPFRALVSVAAYSFENPARIESSLSLSHEFIKAGTLVKVSNNVRR